MCCAAWPVAGVYLALVAVFGVALGMMIRSSAGAIATLVGILLILPGLASLLPDSLYDTLSPYFPSTAGQAVYALEQSSDALSPGAGLAVFMRLGGPGPCRGGLPARPHRRLIGYGTMVVMSPHHAAAATDTGRGVAEASLSGFDAVWARPLLDRLLGDRSHAAGSWR